MQPKFKSKRGKSKADNCTTNYHPFAFLDRERQRAIVKQGHPEELSVYEHLGGLCAMALEQIRNTHEAYGIVQHIGQILDDHGYIPWTSIRSFSNTIIANIAKGRYTWHDERAIERCRNNVYMKTRAGHETQWAVPCPKYNKGRCTENDSHTVGEVAMMHVCAFCATSGYDNPHTNRACNKRKGTGSNTAKSGYEEKKEYRGNRHPHRGDKAENVSKN